MYNTSKFVSHQINIYMGILLFIVKMYELIHQLPEDVAAMASVFWFVVQYLACRLASVK